MVKVTASSSVLNNEDDIDGDGNPIDACKFASNGMLLINTSYQNKMKILCLYLLLMIYFAKS